MLRHLTKTDSEALRSELARTFLSGDEEFDLHVLEERGWSVMPVEANIDDEAAEHLAKAASTLGVSRGLAVTTEAGVEIEGVQVDLTVDGLLEFDANCMLRVFLLVGEGGGFALLDEADYFYLIAGPPEFVRMAVGGDLATAEAAFLQYASRPSWPERTREFLLGILRRYRSSRGN